MKKIQTSLLLTASAVLLGACGQNATSSTTSSTQATTQTTQATTQESTEESASSLANAALPSFGIVDNDGNAITQAKFAGKPTLYVAWASWCPDCQEQLPILNELRTEYADKVQFVFVNLLVRGETEEKAHTYMEEKGYNFDYYADKNADFQKQMKLQSIPTMILVDKDGMVQTVFEEVQTKESLSQALDALQQ